MLERLCHGLTFVFILVGIMSATGAKGKRVRTSVSSSSAMQFDNNTFQERYDALCTKPFGQTRVIDWEILEQLGLADDVRQLVGFDRWLAIFDIDEPVYRELTLEVLSTFE